MSNEHLTLAEYSASINDLARRHAVRAVVEDLTRHNVLLDMLSRDRMPPTRWQRFKYRLADIRQRAKDIWTILRGGDIHENCGY